MDHMEKERIASLEAKMDYLIKAIDNLSDNLDKNYVRRIESELRFSEMEKKISKLETAPHKWLSTFLSVCGTIIALLALFFR